MEDIGKKFNIIQKKIRHDVNGRYKTNAGGDKITSFHYNTIYEPHFDKFKDQKINLLEIGILEGDGLVLFSNYLPMANIYGSDIDINPTQNKLSHWLEIGALKEKPILFEGNSTVEEFAEKTYNGLKFDIIVDDGDHKPTSMIKTFKNMFKYLNDGGIYFIEDVTDVRIPILRDYFENNNIEYKFERHESSTHGIVVIKK